ncbi:MAG: hypothetical protein JSR33_03630 [Proteobacteria bacterium]|nr:hypothetical protein [Pseudomonadota bacterium]
MKNSLFNNNNRLCEVELKIAEYKTDAALNKILEKVTKTKKFPKNNLEVYFQLATENLSLCSLQEQVIFICFIICHLVIERISPFNDNLPEEQIRHDFLLQQYDIWTKELERIYQTHKHTNALSFIVHQACKVCVYLKSFLFIGPVSPENPNYPVYSELTKWIARGQRSKINLVTSSSPIRTFCSIL